MNLIESHRMFAWVTCVFRADSGAARPDRNKLIEQTTALLMEIGNTQVDHTAEDYRVEWVCSVPLNEERRQRVYAALVAAFGTEVAKSFCWYGTETRIETRVAVSLGNHVQ